MPSLGLTLPSGRLEVTITHHGKRSGAPMLSEHFEEDILDDFVIIWLGILDPITGLVIAAVKEGLPDIWYAYDLNEFSDEMKQELYHEFGHASHYTHVNTTDFWGVYRSHIIFHGGYGNGDDNNSELIALSEPFAEVIGSTMADMTYGIAHSNGDPILHRWIHLLEEQGVIPPPSDDWIPLGIYLDFIDNNANYPIGVGEPIDDNISGYSINLIFSQLNGSVRDMTELRQQMLSVLPSGNLATDLNLIFTEYGY